MLKVRYVRLRFDLEVFKSLAERASRLGGKRLETVQVDSTGVIFLYTTVRQLNAVEILPDGTEVKTSVPTMERHSVRIFRAGATFYMALIDPPRGTRIQSDVLSLLMPEQEFFSNRSKSLGK